MLSEHSQVTLYGGAARSDGVVFQVFVFSYHLALRALLQRRRTSIRRAKKPPIKIGGKHNPKRYYLDSSGNTETVFLSPFPRLKETIPAIFANKV